MENDNTLVQLVTAEVMRQLAQQSVVIHPQKTQFPYKALVIFTGGTIGLEQGLKEVKKVQQYNAEVTVLLTGSAEKIIGIDKIKEELGSHVGIITPQSPYPRLTLQDSDIVIIPVLTQNTAAKLAYTLSDTMVSTVILQALMRGIPVVAAYNAADPLDSWRVHSNMGKASPGLLQALRGNLQKLDGYGMQLVEVASLAMESKKRLERNVKVSAKEIQGTGKKNILDAAAIKALADNGSRSISVCQGTIITPLARDTARDLGIQIVEERVNR